VEQAVALQTRPGRTVRTVRTVKVVEFGSRVSGRVAILDVEISPRRTRSGKVLN